MKARGWNVSEVDVVENGIEQRFRVRMRMRATVGLSPVRPHPVAEPRPPDQACCAADWPQLAARLLAPSPQPPCPPPPRSQLRRDLLGRSLRASRLLQPQEAERSLVARAEWRRGRPGLQSGFVQELRLSRVMIRAFVHRVRSGSVGCGRPSLHRADR